MSIFTGLWKGVAKSSPVAKSYTQTTSRPAIMQPYMATDTGAKLPIFPFPLIMMYELASMIDALRIPIETLNRETFKNSFEIVEKFKYKCENCSKEFEFKPLKDDDDAESPGDNKPETSPKKELLHPQKAMKIRKSKEILECDSCGSKKLIRPVPEHRKVLEKLYTLAVNNNDQTLEDVMRQIERDLEVADNAYLLLLKNYHIEDRTGKIDWDGTTIKEILRVDPPQVAMIADSDGRIGFDDKRIPVYVCPHFEHRDKRLTKSTCDRHPVPVQALKAITEVSSVYSIGIPQPKRVIYAEGEIIWKAGKYQPGLIYGFSPIYAVWQKAMSLTHMDEYIKKYFDKMRPPRGLLVVASRNYETFQKAWNVLEQRATEDPYRIFPLLVESEKGGRNMAQWIDFTGSLKELQFIDIRKELRMIIGAMYGVLPLYYGEMPGGWNQEGMQVTITNRAVKWAQDFLAKHFFDKLTHMMGVDDWGIILKPGEEADELRELTIEAQKIQNHSLYQQMGFEVERTHSGEWKVSKKPVNPPMQAGGRGNSDTGNKELTPPQQGQPFKTNPSSETGSPQGHPTPPGAKGSNFNQSQKEGKTSMTKPEEPESVEIIEKPNVRDVLGVKFVQDDKDVIHDKEHENKALWFPTQVENDKPVVQKPKKKKTSRKTKNTLSRDKDDNIVITREEIE